MVDIESLVKMLGKKITSVKAVYDRDYDVIIGITIELSDGTIVSLEADSVDLNPLSAPVIKVKETDVTKSYGEPFRVVHIKA